MFSTEISISPMVLFAVLNPSREGRERRNQNDLEVSIMRKLISCEFNMDTACVELRYHVWSQHKKIMNKHSDAASRNVGRYSHVLFQEEARITIILLISISF